MTNPITPPPELVQQWNTEGRHHDYCTLTESIAARAAQWGADQELEACCKVLEVSDRNAREFLYAARRPKPKPLSLKEQALEMLENAWEGGHVNNNAAQTIRRVLEQLDD